MKAGDRVRVNQSGPAWERGSTGSIIRAADNGDDWMVLLDSSPEDSLVGGVLSYNTHNLELI